MSYFKAAGLILPALFLAMFAKAFLLPKLEQIWNVTGIGGSRAQFLLDGANLLISLSVYLPWVFILAFTALELRLAAWPRYRRMSLTLLSQFIYWIVLIGMTSLATAALLAAPLLTRSR